MQMRKPVMFLIAVAALMTASCGATKPSRYYAIEVPTATAGAASAMPVTLLVGRVTAPHILRDDRIAYRSTATEIGMYEYHRWAEPPATMMEALVVRRLRGDGRYRSVQSLSSNAQGDYILRGRLHQFEEVSGASGLTARVSLEMELFDKKSGTVVWTNLFKAEETVNGKEVPAVVDALNTGTQRVLDQIATGLSTYFAQHPPK
jgi:ABC-type uncharacterized transport system auxiliary subunit